MDSFTTENYGVGQIPFTSLKEQIDNFGGEIDIRVIKVLNPVVQGSKRALGECLVFAVFYKCPSGKYFDAIQKHDGKHKIFMNSEVLSNTLEKMGLIDKDITFPVRHEGNVLNLNSLK
jgi:hypothetical protein